MSTTASKNPPAKKQKAAAAGTTKGKPGRKKKDQSIATDAVKAALERLKKGETTLIAESKKLGFTHNGPLRAALRALIGLDKYNALMGPRTPKAKAQVKAQVKAAPKAKAKKAAPKAKAAAVEAAPVADTQQEQAEATVSA